MFDKRSLRSSKPEQSATNGENSIVSDQSTAAGKSALSRTALTRTKSSNTRKTSPTDKDSADDNASRQTNGIEPIENGVNGTHEVSHDVEMGDEASDTVDKSKSMPSQKDKDGDDEMTVVVPQPKSSKLVGTIGQDDRGDVIMDGVESTQETKSAESEVEKVDPIAKAVAGMSDHCDRDRSRDDDKDGDLSTRR